jgi:hypothetical protein
MWHIYICNMHTWLRCDSFLSQWDYVERTARSVDGRSRWLACCPPSFEPCVRRGCLTGVFPSTAQAMSWLFSSLTRGCATIVRVTCPSRATPGWLRIPLSHVQPLRIGVGLACALDVCTCVVMWVSAWVQILQLVLGVLRHQKKKKWDYVYSQIIVTYELHSPCSLNDFWLADSGGCWFVVREKYRWMTSWFWLMSSSEQGLLNIATLTYNDNCTPP